MFWRKFWEKRKTKEKEPDYDVESENLAIPEVHLHGCLLYTSDAADDQ